MSLLEAENKAEDQAKAVANERVKLRAAYMNGIAMAVFAVGGFAPFVAATTSGNPSALKPIVLLVMSACWLMSGIIHAVAVASLKDLR